MKTKILLSISSLAIGGLIFSGATVWAIPGFFSNGGDSFAELATLGTNDNFGLRIETNNTERARFDTSGNFGIGTTTPSSKLDVSGTANISGNTTVGGTLGVTGAATFSSGTTISCTGCITSANLATTLNGKTLITPTISDFSNAIHNHQNNTGGGTLSESSLVLTDITTNDVSTTKHGFVPKAPNDTTKFLRGDATWAAVTVEAPKTKVSTDFETSSRFTSTTAGGSTAVFNTNGLVLETVGAGASVRVDWLIGGSNGTPALFNGNPSFSTQVTAIVLNSSDTSGSFFAGIGQVGRTGDTSLYTNNHIGFKFVRNGTTTSLFATQGDGTTENASSALTTIVDNDVIDMSFRVNGTSSVDYYWRKNGGSLSTINLTSNLPTAAEKYIQFTAASANTTGSNLKYSITAASYER